MKNKTRKYCDIPPDLVCAALNGSDDGYAQLLKFYEPYISRLSLMQVWDADGEYKYSFVDDDLKQLMQIGIIRASREFAKKII